MNGVKDAKILNSLWTDLTHFVRLIISGARNKFQTDNDNNMANIGDGSI